MDKHTIMIGLLGAILVGVFLVGIERFPDKVSLSPEDQNTITVTGEAERFVAPDTARISFSMTRKDRVLSTATDSVNKRIGELLTGLEEFGVEEKHIKTTNYQVYPEYDYSRDSGARTFSGYRVSQNIELKIVDLDQVSNIVSTVPQYEVDNVSGLTFYTDDDEQIRDELREEAIDDAKDKARDLARDLGVSLDDIVGFSEGGGGYNPQPVYSRLQNSAFAEDEAIEASLPAGENEMRATVSITYRIDD